MPNYVVQQGDCLSSIGERFGFHWKSLWNHPENNGLRLIRGNPNILYPGDVVHIPDPRIKQYPAATNKRHTFKLKVTSAKLRLRLLTGNQPRANEPYQLEIDGTLVSGTTDPNGRIDHAIPASARVGRLILRDGLEQYPLKLGHLDPIDEISGIQARLRSLGYYRGAIDGQLNSETHSAIKRLQKKKGLAENGEPDGPTKDVLKAEFGS